MGLQIKEVSKCHSGRKSGKEIAVIISIVVAVLAKFAERERMRVRYAIWLVASQSRPFLFGLARGSINLGGLIDLVHFRSGLGCSRSLPSLASQVFLNYPYDLLRTHGSFKIIKAFPVAFIKILDDIPSSAYVQK